MAKCKLCRKGEAVVPDRNSMSSRKAVCRECHGKRLLGDIRKIMKIEEERRRALGEPNRDAPRDHPGAEESAK